MYLNIYCTNVVITIKRYLALTVNTRLMLFLRDHDIMVSLYQFL